MTQHPSSHTAAASQPLKVRGLSVSIGGQPILKKIHFDSVPEGVVAVMGPSGCGKSTLLKALMGLHRCDEGEIIIDERFPFQANQWNEEQKIFTLVPQVPVHLPWKTILQNVALAADSQETTVSALKRAEELLSIVGLSEAKKLYPWQVSHGMAARASLARTLMIKSQILLLDEPFAAIDATTRFHLQQWLLHMIRQLKIQALLVTHDPREALLVADEILVLGRRHPAVIVEKFTLPNPTERKKRDWIFGSEAGELERQIRSALGATFRDDV